MTNQILKRGEISTLTEYDMNTQTGAAREITLELQAKRIYTILQYDQQLPTNIYISFKHRLNSSNLNKADIRIIDVNFAGGGNRGKLKLEIDNTNGVYKNISIFADDINIGVLSSPSNGKIDFDQLIGL